MGHYDKQREEAEETDHGGWFRDQGYHIGDYFVAKENAQHALGGQTLRLSAWGEEAYEEAWFATAGGQEVCLYSFEVEWLSSLPPQDTPTTRDHHVGSSNYSDFKIQPWDIWEEYQLNPWDADIVKRTLRTKAYEGKTPEEARIEDYEKIIHVAQERIRQLKERT